MIRQGGHQAAVKSTRTSPRASKTSTWKESSVTASIVVVGMANSMDDRSARHQSKS